MAIDTWLLEQHRLGLHPPTLRFYTWSPVAISLGYHQKQYPAFWSNLTWNGEPVDLVRRPSGGRAVLHQGDLTYAVITSGLPGSRMQAYQTICEFLVQGWRTLGVDLTYGEAGRGYIHQPNCFGTATAADLVTVSGAKLIGSAQLRRGSAILQHGSMRLNTDPALYRRVFESDLELLQCPTQETLQIIRDLSASAQTCFKMRLAPQPLTTAEWEQISQLVQAKRQAKRFTN
jgi:lipoate---protein ligase